MKTKIYKIDKNNIDDNKIKEAAAILKEGGLVAFPTETVYGLGANALDVDAANKIYKAKGRPSDNPLIVHIANVESLNELVAYLPEKGKKVIEAFWPGPLTLILNKSKNIPDNITGGLNTVAVRMPSHPIAIEVIKEAKIPIAAPSANTSGRPSPTNANHVIEDLEGKIDMIIDGGMVDIGLESTVIDFTSDIPLILRPGYITKEMIENVIGKIEIDKALLEEFAHSEAPRSPGMKYKHYAPKAPLNIIDGELDKVVCKINELLLDNEKKGLKVGIIATKQTKMYYNSGIVKVIGDRNHENEIAKHLFKTLREFDALGVDIILSESFNENYLGQAIMNRLLKASGYKIIKVN
ncbi:translation factor SUA5 [Natranaerovirga pectinivora]|uniref:Threonylcarbamoyl-AMP synthase n=1 Tax=Natranaerovirga pectinivora TaxID=682400 RepID=A0A4R3MKX9_9FIRM|nr:L-threonylcarbamoyladenylate synthase [Natranaerovirga pectinivora]TCT13100.1 translation factor SUA5 [Natranaerovirga pectinivora]